MYLSKILFNYLIIAALSLIFTSSNFAQDELKEKVKKIKGNVNNITITADGTTHIFEGEEAEKLFKKMQGSFSSTNSFVMKLDDDDEDKTLIFINSDGDKKIIELDGDEDLIWESEDGEFEKMEKRINVEVEDGKKKVTVITNENGEEKTEVYEGEEAEKYLEEMKSKNGNGFEFEFDDESGKKVKKIKIEKRKEEKK